MPDKCDMEQGPCACGAWHDKPRVYSTPVVTLLQAAKNLRAAQRDYMALRLSHPEKDPIRQAAGELVGIRAEELDRAIERTEARQDADLAAGLLLLNEAKRLLTGISERLEAKYGPAETRRAIMATIEPSLSEQREMGVHPSGGEIIP